ncbi:MAG TPA: hypothetical protein VLW17_10905 [Thermoanaerobaculaceae bacterium]|nr:hypothetical protein [Thermoanaerobaculaceae bacterium]
MKRIGVLRGMENTFPEALISAINATYGGEGVRAEFVALDPISLAAEPGYDVILDRISHEVPFFRSYLKWAALRGTYVVNNPFWWSADDKFIDNEIAARLGVAVPRTVILPHKQHPPNTQATSFRNLRYPIDWPATFAHVGFPAYLKPHDGGGWRGVTKVRNPQEFFAAYDASGTACMMLQESVEFEDYYRCYCIGRTDVHVMRYNPAAPHDQRYTAVAKGPVPAAMRQRLERDVRALCVALGYDVNTVEFAVRGGVPYAIDFMNPAPDADRHSVGEANFQWVVKTMAAFLAGKAREERRTPQFDAQRLLFGAGMPAGAHAAASPRPVEVKAEPRKAEPPKPVAAKTEAPKAAKPKTEPHGAEAPKPAPPKAEPHKPQPHKAEPHKPQPPKAEPPKPAPRKPEPHKAGRRAEPAAKGAPAKAPAAPAKSGAPVRPKPVARPAGSRITPATGRARPSAAHAQAAKPVPKPARPAARAAKPAARPTKPRPKPVRPAAKPVGRIKPAKAASGRAAKPAKKPSPPARPPARKPAGARPRPAARPATAKPPKARPKPATGRRSRS